MLPDLKQAGEKPVPNAGTKSVPGRGCSRMLGMGNFPDFSGKFPVPWKCHSGTQTSIMPSIFVDKELALDHFL